MNNSKKVYMVLTNGFDPDVRVYKEAKYLVEKGFEVEILCWDRKGDYKEKTEEKIDGIKITRFEIPSIPGSGMKQIIPFLNFVKCVRKHLKDKEYGYLHCHDFDGIIVGICTKRVKKIKLIFDMHEIYDHYAYADNKIFNIVFNKILNTVNYVIYVNEKQIQNLTDNQKTKLIYLPNYPEKSTYTPIEKTKSSKPRINYIGSVRDYDSLNNLMKIANECDEVVTGIYGTGVCIDKLKENNKNQKTKLYGKYDGIRDSGDIYRNTDILYCSYNPNISNWNNAYPVKLFEAIVTLTPIIVSKNTVAGDFVLKNKIGEVIEYNNVESLKKAIFKVNNNYLNYIESLKKICDTYKWEEIVKNLKDIYNYE